jgi:hypothetical protein
MRPGPTNRASRRGSFRGACRQWPPGRPRKSDIDGAAETLGEADHATVARMRSKGMNPSFEISGVDAETARPVDGRTAGTEAESVTAVPRASPVRVGAGRVDHQVRH